MCGKISQPLPGNIDISQDSASSQGKPNRQAEAAASPLLVSDLDWSAEEAKETRARLAALEEDWDAPGMEAYDHLFTRRGDP